MRILLVAVLVALTVYVSGEHCSSTISCYAHGITHCGGQSHVACRSGDCECLSTTLGATCSSVSECSDCSFGRNKHCVDGHCRCTRN